MDSQCKRTAWHVIIRHTYRIICLDLSWHILCRVLLAVNGRYVCLLQFSLAQPLVSIVIHHSKRSNTGERKWVSEWVSVSEWLNVSECEWEARDWMWVSVSERRDIEYEWVSEWVSESEWLNVSECEWEIERGGINEWGSGWLTEQGSLYVSVN